MRDHRRLRAYELARDLALSVYRTTDGFPERERYGLSAQMRRAAVSVGSNIVEGCARSSDAEYLRFLEIAYGSAQELAFQVELATRLEFLIEPESQALNSLVGETARVLFGLIRSVRQAR